MRLRKALHAILSKKLGLLRSDKKSAYTAMNQCYGKFKKGCSRQLKVDFSILEHIYFLDPEIWEKPWRSPKDNCSITDTQHDFRWYVAECR